MRRVLLLAVLGLAGCPPTNVEKLPPAAQFYFPTGLVHVDVARPADAGVHDGILYVANSNSDRRYDFGSVMAVDLSRLGLPEFGAIDTGLVAKQIPDLKVDPSSIVQVASFAGEMAALPTDGGVRLFLPTRSELNRIYAVDAPAPTATAPIPKLSCFVTDAGPPVGQNCTPSGLTLVALEKTETGIPRAPAPIGIAVSPPPKRDVWITALQQADSPKGSTLEQRGYVVHINGDDPNVAESSFVNVGLGGTNTVVVGKRYAYATGKAYANNVPASLLRAIETSSFTTINMSLENTVTVSEARGAALASNEKRLYLIGRSPDTLLVNSVEGSETSTPQVRVQRSIPLPEGPTLIAAIPRIGKSDLVAISCATSGVVAFYDDEVGDLVAQLVGVGQQPYAMAVDRRMGANAEGARIYVSNFADGQIAVIDVADLSRPSGARIVAFLGDKQLCLTRGSNDRIEGCDGGTR